MALYSTLDTVNDMLRTLGETPLNSLEDEHPLVASAVRILSVASAKEQAKSWWFNKELVTLAPDAVTGYIATPDDAIRIDPTDPSMNYVQRGRRLYQPYASASVDKYKFTRPVQCWIVRCLAFEDLPPSAQSLVAACAILDFQKDFDADATKYAQLKQDYATALMLINAENTRNLNINMLDRLSMREAVNRLSPHMRYLNR